MPNDTAANPYGPKYRPTEIRVKQEEKTLELDFEDGSSFSLPAELLRVESPSAEVQGHGPEEKKIIAGRKHVSIMGVEPVGNYAVTIKFDDLHDTGIYSWDTLYEMGVHKDEIWQTYLDNVEKLGLSREPS